MVSEGQQSAILDLSDGFFFFFYFRIFWSHELRNARLISTFFFRDDHEFAVNKYKVVGGRGRWQSYNREEQNDRLPSRIVRIDKS